MDDTMANPASPSPWKKWLIAARPWSWPASTMAVVFGTSLAVVIGGARLDALRFIWAFATMVVLHSASNMLSDVFDFRHGLDKEVTPVSGAIVRGWLSDRQVLAGAVTLFLVGGASGFLIALVTGRDLFIVGGLGIAVGAAYTLLKARALGDLAVFLDFGLLGSAGAWMVQTRSYSWLPFLWAVPMAMLVIAILHANNWRDSLSDKEHRINTVAGLLGDKGSFIYYGVNIFAGFVFYPAIILIPRLVPRTGLVPMPWTFFVAFLALPSALKLWKRAVLRATPRQPMDFIILDGATANHNLVFGLLSTAAVWFEALRRLL